MYVSGHFNGGNFTSKYEMEYNSLTGRYEAVLLLKMGAYVVGVWQFSTKGAASSIKNIRNSFDGVQLMRGTVCQTAFDLSVQFAKSNKPGSNSRYPVVSLVANDTRIDEIRKAIAPTENLSLLLPAKSK